ncbi:MDR family MFS transporter [Aspergillus saccharolyticus JOP 1030-1]|uniref:Efflux pump antibiotic resistance protein n=1 Tax=Aspergillus saccharolyticus JOP 1030-1 TaxID=1450539 RepID=A0A318Z6Z8_9EURO|nr:efflux pump antibiotic resistance protein [Aspergillus saccharolyticus JOP 1030-1]PYH43101.1 efflux pump antibiotic resistance protein [Aspergillus saccharolyticus JOP 1030-1]
MAQISDNADHNGNGTSTSRRELTFDGISEPTHVAPGLEYPTGTKFWLLMLTIAAVLMLISIDMNIVATAVPSITNHFHTIADVGWYSSAFRLSQCAFQFVFGQAYQRFSIKRVFLFANATLIAGSLICGAAATSSMLIVGRAVAGLGTAGLLSGCFVILVHSTPLRRRPMFTGVMGAIEGLATLSAPLVGGAIVQSLGWRWCFYINAPIGAVTFLLTTRCFSDPPNPSNFDHTPLRGKLRQLDLLSNLFFIPALTSLFLALSWAGTKYPWRSSAVITPLVAFVILMAAFIFHQIRREDTAALPLRILKHRSIIAGSIFIMCGNSTGNVLEYYLPTYYQVVRGYSPAQSGYLMLPIILAGTIGALVHGFGTSALGYYAPFMLAASIIMPIAAGLITTFELTTSLTQLITYTAFSGLGYGVGFSGPQNAVQTVLPAEDVSLGTSVLLFAQSFGPAVAIAIAQVLFLDRLELNLGRMVPGLRAADLNSMGLTQIVTELSPERATEARLAVDRSIIQTWYLVVGLACATMVGSLLMEWRSVKTRRD